MVQESEFSVQGLGQGSGSRESAQGCGAEGKKGRREQVRMRTRVASHLPGLGCRVKRCGV